MSVLYFVGLFAFGSLLWRLHSKKEIQKALAKGDIYKARSELFSFVCISLGWFCVVIFVAFAFLFIAPLLLIVDFIDRKVGLKVNNLFGKIVDRWLWQLKQ